MLHSMGLKRVGHDLAIEQHIYMEYRKMVLMYLFAGQVRENVRDLEM